MPELPEVETIARGLREIIGQRITSVDVRYPGSLNQSPEAFEKAVVGCFITGTRRRAKLLIVDLEDVGGNPLHLIVHLKMTGRLWVPPKGETPDKHTHVVMTLAPVSTGPDTLHFRDVRKFGWCQACTSEELGDLNFYKTLGPEPLEIGPEDFVELFRNRRAAIKGLLLNQKVIAGIGNIYADESLFRAGVHPAAKADSVPVARLKKLHKELQAVLRQAIQENGSSISDYRDARGDAGAFQNKFRVYGRAGEACVNCGNTLQSMKVAGRTTTYCNRCQQI